MPVTSDVRTVQTYFDDNTLSFELWNASLKTSAMVVGAVTQSGTWNATINAALPAGTANIGDIDVLTVPYVSLTAASGSVAVSGNNTLITPTAGKALRVYYASYNPALAVEAAFRFGAAGTLWLRNSVTANSVVAKDFNALRYLQGGVDAVLFLNLSAAVTTLWNCFYEEI